MLPTDMRVVLGDAAMSYSEFASLSSCEAKWAFGYRDQLERPKETSVAMQRGSDLHSLIQHYWLTGEVTATEADETANWVMQRYAEQYPDPGGPMKVEVPFVHQVPGGPTLFGYMDGLTPFQVHEIKTSYAIEDVLHLERSPQMVLYYMAAKALCPDVQGVTLDLVRTYKPKRDLDALPLEASFRQVHLTFTDTEVQETLDQLAAAHWVKQQLRDEVRVPIKHVSRSCGYCSYVAPCSGRTVTLSTQHETGAEND